MEADQEKRNKVYFYKETTATEKVFDLNKRIRAVKGGTSASKTISILVWLIDYCNTLGDDGKTEIVTIASESFPHLNLGAIRDFKSIMRDRGYWNNNLWNDGKHIYTFETGNIIEFMSVDTYSKAHGPRRDVLFLNECNNLPWEIVDQLIIRTRKIVWMDWNPTEEFWFHTELLAHRKDIDYITLNYKDNEALDVVTVKEIESHRHNTQWWNVYGLGLDGEIVTRIYTGWEFIDEVPQEARLRVKGLDFGYTNDPTALIDLYEWNEGYIVDEIVYEKGLMNNQIAKLIGRKTVITIGDSAEPKSIDEIAQHGVNIIGSKKGKGSISHGIDSVRSKKIYVTKRSVNVIKEYRNYIWITDKNNKVINEPRDLFNHTMDAIRYAVSFLNPVNEDEDNYIQPPYEAPGLRTMKSGAMPVSTIQPVNPRGTHKERMQALLNRKKDIDSYETDTPWQAPGIKL